MKRVAECPVGKVKRCPEMEEVAIVGSVVWDGG